MKFCQTCCRLLDINSFEGAPGGPTGQSGSQGKSTRSATTAVVRATMLRIVADFILNRLETCSMGDVGKVDTFLLSEDEGLLCEYIAEEYCLIV